MPNLTNVKEKL
jgi:hypothetical protein